MSWENPNFVTKRDVGIAYRKAKADIYYQRDHPNAFALCDYEERLESNLGALFDRLTSGNLGWMTTAECVGDWAVIPKSIADHREATRRAAWQPSDPDHAWRVWVEAGHARHPRKKPTAEFRLVGVHSIDFHVTSALWMLKVGHLYDGILGRESYGSRMRRTRPEHAENPRGRINNYSLGSFRQYFRPFGEWRDKGLRTMRDALDDKKRVVAITADVRQFYHRTSPDFLLHDEYLQAFGLQEQLGADERQFTQALIDALHAWAARTPVHCDEPEVGLPVGLPAARLIANVALAELDRVVVRELGALYYGRYVDDILLVLEDKQGFRSSREVWKYVCRKTGKVLKLATAGEEPAIEFKRRYLGKSQIRLVGSKQKVFLLEGVTGKALVKSIARQIRERASEWRALPDRPARPDALAADLVSAVGADGEQVDNLRKTESLSLRRGALAIRLRDMEAFEQDLDCDSWEPQRHAFLETVRFHLVALPQFFDFAEYLPRVFALAIACGDYDQARALLARLKVLIRQIEKDCFVSLAAIEGKNQDILGSWCRHLIRSLTEAVASALAPDQQNDAAEIEAVLRHIGQLSPAGREGESSLPVGGALDALSRARRLFARDMGRVAYRMRYFPYRIAQIWDTDDATSASVRVASPFIDRRMLEDVASLSKRLKPNEQGVPLAMLYPTRPFHVDELYILLPDMLVGPAQTEISRWALAFRGFFPAEPLPGLKDSEGPILVPRTKVQMRRRIAVTSWETSEHSWKASIVAQPDLGRRRYQRLNRLMNAVLRSQKAPDYVVLPELSIPSRWFFRIASKLMNRGISLIAGVEYIHHPDNSDGVANQVWASLVSDFLGFPSLVVYRQDKARPAPHEEDHLAQIGNKRLDPILPPQKPTLRHGDFHFGIMVCSELTNVEYQTQFRGKVDAVFVPEWNQDTETFCALVESAALSIHTYVVQCNNRLYGDSRIRSPAKDLWQRDIVRVKGGIEDYFVIGEIDVVGLRQFQSAYRSSLDGPFKPVPDGFQISPERRRIP